VVSRTIHKLTLCGFLAVAMFATRQLNAQNQTLEGYTGGFITPTAYVAYSDKGQFFSHPSVSYHFLNANSVIGDIHTFGIAEGFANRAEVSYARSVHVAGDSPAFSALWNFPGMNVFAGKVVLVKDGQGGELMPGIAVGGIVRTDDKFVSGALYQEIAALSGVSVAAKAYTNEDIYVALTKTWLKPPVPLLVNFGWKATNASILGIGGQATRFGGRLFGGLGIPLPLPHGFAMVPSAGFTQEPPQVKYLGDILIGGSAHIPTTLDYAVRVTQKEHPHVTFDIGVGQVAGNIGQTPIIVDGTPVGVLPVDLQARHVVGLGLGFRY
jgi:hypothetical protein